MMAGSKQENGASDGFPLELLPWHVQKTVVKRLDMLSFARLQPCSKGSLALCRDSEHLPFINVDTLTVGDSNNIVVNWFCESRQRNVSSELNRMDPSTCRIHVEYLDMAGGPFDTNCCNMFRGRSVRIHGIRIQGPVNCTAEEFNSFLEVHGIKEVDICLSLGSIDWENLLKQPAVKELPSIRIGKDRFPNFPAQDVLHLRATVLLLPFVHSTVVQTMLQEWREGVREITLYAFWTVTDLSAMAYREQQVSAIQTGILAPFMEIGIRENRELNLVCMTATMTRNDRGSLAIANYILDDKVLILVGTLNQAVNV